MNMRDIDNLYAAEIRAIQGMHAAAHKALCNWALWSMDRYNIGPKDARPSFWDQYKYEEGDYAEVKEDRLPDTAAPAKAEGPEKEPYDERAGSALDERIHQHLPEYLRRTLRIAYVQRCIPEEQFPRQAGCLPQTFKERLAEALAIMGRFV